jgi:hypothetical protein
MEELVSGFTYYSLIRALTHLGEGAGIPYITFIGSEGRSCRKILSGSGWSQIQNFAQMSTTFIIDYHNYIIN